MKEQVKAVKVIKTAFLLPMVLSLLMATATAQNILFSHNGGFYADTFSLAISCSSPLYTIHYTLDGSVPTADDPLYTSPLLLSQQLYSPSNIYTIPNAPPDFWNHPDSVERIIVVRAASFNDQGQRSSAVETHSYIIQSLLHRNISLPVVSICVDSVSLFDTLTGIFVPGVNYDTSLPRHSGNYFMRGDEWEREASFSLYCHDGDNYSQQCGIRTHGNVSRVYPQKGLSLYARNEYGASRFEYPFFAKNQNASYIQSFKRLALKPWMCSWSGAGIEDWLCQQIASSLLIDKLATTPVVLFLNGEYWGIYFLSEKPDRHYLESHHDIDPDEVDLITYWSNLEYGTIDRWEDFFEWLQEADLSDTDSYNYLASQVDIDELIDYMLLEIFISNVDWPLYNSRIWSVPSSKWRFIFYDADAALASWRSNDEVLSNLICNTDLYSTSPEATLLFRRLLFNHHFFSLTKQRFTHLASTVFSFFSTAPLFSRAVSLVGPEVPYQIARFGIPVSLDAWHHAVSDIKRYLSTRPVSMPKDYSTYIQSILGPLSEPSIIAPNPSSGPATLYLKATDYTESCLIVSSLDGRILHRQSVSLRYGHNIIPLPQMHTGLYVVYVTGQGRPAKWLVR